MITFNQLKKNLKKSTEGMKQVKLAVVADSASQFIGQAIKGFGIQRNLNFDIFEADYDQVDRQVLDFSSDLYAFEPEFIVLNFSSEHLLKNFYKLDFAGKENFASKKVEHIAMLAGAISSKLNSKILVNSFIEINDNVYGNYATKVEASFIYQIRKANLLLMEAAQQAPNVFIYDLAMLQSQYGYHFSFDAKMYVSADMVYSLDFLPLIAQSVVYIIQSISGVFKKCLILDLDNTTWGGVIGDDGVEGIQVGALGVGKAFTDLQLWAKQLKERGIILAVCSKNTESVAKEPFENHPDMVLRLDDIAVFNANWENKVDNIRHIQSVLNIGFDSMVFLDDNPFEREIVRSAIPQLTIPELPEDPAEYLAFLRTLNLFETASFTKQDQDRTRQYQQEAKRNVLQKSFANEGEFLESLDMVSNVASFNKFSIPRVAQLSQRSNQFNLRTVRYTDEDIQTISKSDDFVTFSFDLADKFGDHGLISIVILKKVIEKSLFIDTWIMSCRVLKRGMENFVLNTIIQYACENKFETIIGEYLPTAKNGLVKDHYEQLGFSREKNKWILKVKAFKCRPTFIAQISQQVV